MIERIGLGLILATCLAGMAFGLCWVTGQPVEVTNAAAAVSAVLAWVMLLFLMWAPRP